MHLLTNVNKSGQLLLTGITFQWGADSKNNASVCSLRRLRGASVIRGATSQRRFQALADSQNQERDTYRPRPGLLSCIGGAFIFPFLCFHRWLFYQMWLLIMTVLCAISGLTEGKLNHINSTLLLLFILSWISLLIFIEGDVDLFEDSVQLVKILLEEGI